LINGQIRCAASPDISLKESADGRRETDLYDRMWQFGFEVTPCSVVPKRLYRKELKEI